ncbi:DUF3592 domain-containing protein [Hellea sp.]|nr:DUF3592 domain-containing protein [Hellea sp.]
MGKAAFYLFWALLFGWSGQKLAIYGYGLYQKGKASESWTPVTANIDSFKMKSTSRGSSRTGGGRSGGSTQYIEVLYNYEYEGSAYTGDTTGFGPYTRRTFKRPRRGKSEVYVNPQDPSESVYIQGVSKPNLAGIALAIGLVLAGLWFAVLSLRSLVSR